MITEQNLEQNFKALLKFILKIGKLKGKERKGWQIHQIKNAETTAEHTFHLAILVWVLGKNKNLNLERMIKMALVHDLCEVHTPDITPYDPLLPKNKKKIIEVLECWPRLTSTMKIKKGQNKFKLENKALNKLIFKLPPSLKAEIKNLWLDYKKGLTAEGRFVKQAGKTINLLQGLEYWKKQGKIQHGLWIRWIGEVLDDPTLLKFLEAIEKEFLKKKKRQKFRSKKTKSQNQKSS